MCSCKRKIKDIGVSPCNLSVIVNVFCIFCGLHPELMTLNFQLETRIFQDVHSTYLLTALVASELTPNH